jgi:hypothetical protein
MKTGHKRLVVTTSGKWIEIRDSTLILQTAIGTSILKSQDWSTFIKEPKKIIQHEEELLGGSSILYLNTYNKILIANSISEEFLLFKIGAKIPTTTYGHMQCGELDYKAKIAKDMEDYWVDPC